MDLRLRPLRIDDEHQARAAHAELARDGFAFLLDWESAIPWGTYLEGLGRRRRGLDLSGDRVPAAFLVADVGGELVGRVSIRYALNAFLADFGGHIGYGVRPGHRDRLMVRRGSRAGRRPAAAPPARPAPGTADER